MPNPPLSESYMSPRYAQGAGLAPQGNPNDAFAAMFAQPQPQSSDQVLANALLNRGNSYDTKLTPQEEAKFQKEYPDPRSTQDYDMRGAWKAGATKTANGHLPDTWKKPNHITFSNESIYHGINGNKGGSWNELPGGKWSFTPSETNLKNTPVPMLQRYFQQNEPDSQLVLPK